MRTCLKCEEEKSEVRFYTEHMKGRNGQTWLRYRKWCKNCVVEDRKLINNIEYNSILKKQNGVCAICGVRPNKDKKFFIDHRHLSGVKKKSGGYVRGLLCVGCNSGIGFLKDNIKNLLEAIKYIKFHKKNPNFHNLKYDNSYFKKVTRIEKKSR
jgi:hypothetical protein|tara:strand:+ start:603 stop:1064 length:462 start_codon:yes stop_codon:yes gene_type:complete